MLDILVDDGHVRGLVAMNMMEGTLVQIRANAVVMATGGAGRVYRYNTNGGIVTGDGMGMALSHGVPLRDMEFVQYHPTGLPGCRYPDDRRLPWRRRYSGQQKWLPLSARLRHGPGNSAGRAEKTDLELGPPRKVSQAFWHEWRKGNTISTPRGDVVYLEPASPRREKLHKRVRSSANWRKRTLASIRLKNRSIPVPSDRTLHHGRYRNRSEL